MIGLFSPKIASAITESTEDSIRMVLSMAGAEPDDLAMGYKAIVDETRLDERPVSPFRMMPIKVTYAEYASLILYPDMGAQSRLFSKYFKNYSNRKSFSLFSYLNSTGNIPLELGPGYPFKVMKGDIDLFKYRSILDYYPAIALREAMYMVDTDVTNTSTIHGETDDIVTMTLSDAKSYVTEMTNSHGKYLADKLSKTLLDNGFRSVDEYMDQCSDNTVNMTKTRIIFSVCLLYVLRYYTTSKGSSGEEKTHMLTLLSLISLMFPEDVAHISSLVGRSIDLNIRILESSGIHISPLKDVARDEVTRSVINHMARFKEMLGILPADKLPKLEAAIFMTYSDDMLRSDLGIHPNSSGDTKDFDTEMKPAIDSVLLSKPVKKERSRARAKAKPAPAKTTLEVPEPPGEEEDEYDLSG